VYPRNNCTRTKPPAHYYNRWAHPTSTITAATGNRRSIHRHGKQMGHENWRTTERATTVNDRRHHSTHRHGKTDKLRQRLNHGLRKPHDVTNSHSTQMSTAGTTHRTRYRAAIHIKLTLRKSKENTRCSERFSYIQMYRRSRLYIYIYILPRLTFYYNCLKKTVAQGKPVLILLVNMIKLGILSQILNCIS